MSSLTLLILCVIVATIVGIALFLQWIKSYYWTKQQKEKRRKQGKKDWLD